ncbi:MAG: hypothetical protein IPM82_21795 [Saprospiraceae bacterium]|nr:hypothetical protein [Saprospiraceae bacterium]
MAGDFFNDTDDQSFLFAYGTGPGSYTSASGVRTSAQFASDTVNAVFTQLGANTATGTTPQPVHDEGAGLQGRHTHLCLKAGRPHWFTHHLGALARPSATVTKKPKIPAKTPAILAPPRRGATSYPARRLPVCGRKSWHQ